MTPPDQALPEAAEEAADQLYGVPPGEFVTTRKALAAQAKADGDAAAAKAIAALRKPNAAGWLVNLLVREQPDQIATLLDLGAAMRKAQSRLAAQDLKALSAQRQKLVRALAGQAYDLATDQGEQVSRTVVNQVEDTLSAALADPDCAEQVRGGRLLGPLSYSGFGPAGLTLVPQPTADEGDEAAADEASGDSASVDEAAAGRARRRAQVEHARQVQEATAAVTVAHREVVKAERAAEALTRTLEKAQRTAEQAHATVEELRARLHDAEQAAGKAQARADDTEQALAENARAGETAREQLADAQQVLDDLEAHPPG